MIVWLNGPFGGGKTTTGKLLVAQDERLRLFDPEWVGYLLRELLRGRAVGDFQDYPSWRRLVPIVGGEVARASGDQLVAVQTVLVEDYWVELVRGFVSQGLDVFHVLLTADEAVLRERIETDDVELDGVREWRLRHLPVFLEAQEWMRERADLVVDSTDLTPEEVAAEVARRASTRPLAG